jgi:hypothetical protein
MSEVVCAKTVEKYRRASSLAVVAMGKTTPKMYGDKPRWKAYDDPLAWWCLTEAIINFK